MTKPEGESINRQDFKLRIVHGPDTVASVSFSPNTDADKTIAVCEVEGIKAPQQIIGLTTEEVVFDILRLVGSSSPTVGPEVNEDDVIYVPGQLNFRKFRSAKARVSYQDSKDVYEAKNSV